MKHDECGVAGFFEDLPVLMFVLAGTLIIVVSAVSASKVIVTKDENKELERLAERCAELVLSELLGQHREIVVTVGSVCSTRLSQVIDEFLSGHDYCMSILVVHPVLKWLVQVPGRSAEMPERACTTSRLVNALTDDGRMAILAVRIIVW